MRGRRVDRVGTQVLAAAMLGLSGCAPLLGEADQRGARPSNRILLAPGEAVFAGARETERYGCVQDLVLQCDQAGVGFVCRCAHRWRL
jgi:hypothetical protein